MILYRSVIFIRLIALYWVYSCCRLRLAESTKVLYVHSPFYNTPGRYFDLYNNWSKHHEITNLLTHRQNNLAFTLQWWSVVQISNVIIPLYSTIYAETAKKSTFDVHLHRVGDRTVQYYKPSVVLIWPKQAIASLDLVFKRRGQGRPVTHMTYFSSSPSSHIRQHHYVARALFWSAEVISIMHNNVCRVCDTRFNEKTLLVFANWYGDLLAITFSASTRRFERAENPWCNSVRFQIFTVYLVLQHCHRHFRPLWPDAFYPVKDVSPWW